MARNGCAFRNLFGSEVPGLQLCFITRLREQAQEADWVIVNHALLCADRLLRMQSQKSGHDNWEEKSFGQICPTLTVGSSMRSFA